MIHFSYMTQWQKSNLKMQNFSGPETTKLFSFFFFCMVLDFMSTCIAVYRKTHDMPIIHKLEP